MEVSRNERFKLQVGLAVGGADYRTKIVYQSSDWIVNKKKPKKSNFIQIPPVLIFTVGGVRAFVSNARTEAPTFYEVPMTITLINGTRQWIRRRRHSWWRRARRLR